MSKIPQEEITTDLLLRAYICGVFPMAQNPDQEDLIWLAPDSRGIIELDQFHLPRSFRKILRKNDYVASLNQDFDAVIKSCAAPTQDRESTWINNKIIGLYSELHQMGFAHSVEIWQDETLVGGLYGVQIGAAFFGESMFHRRTNASKIALSHLVASLINSKFKLLDTQFITDHLRQFGTIEIPRDEYEERLQNAVSTPATLQFEPTGAGVLDTILQFTSHAS